MQSVENFCKLLKLRLRNDGQETARVYLDLVDIDGVSIVAMVIRLEGWVKYQRR